MPEEHQDDILPQAATALSPALSVKLGLTGWPAGPVLLIELQKRELFEWGYLRDSMVHCSKGKANSYNDKLPQDALTQCWAFELLKLFP